MKPLTNEIIEASLQRSQRLEQPLTGEKKQVFLEGLLLVPKPWYQRAWQFWFLVPIVGVAVVGIIWYSTTLQSGTSQLANEITTEPEIIPQQQLANTNTQLPEIIIPEPPQPLAARDNTISSKQYYSVGGGPDVDYSTIQFFDPVELPVVAATATVRQRALLTFPELQQLAKTFPVTADQMHLGASTIYVADTDCSGFFLAATTTPCLSITESGMVHFIAADTTASNLDTAQTLITQVTGLSADNFIVTDLGAVSTATTYQEYQINYRDSLVTDGVYRDLGWDVYTHNGKLHSLRGYILPQFSTGQSYNLITPTEALARLRDGFQPFDPDNNPNSTRLYFTLKHYFLITLLQANPEPDLQIDSLDLEYSLAIQEDALNLVPVYYLRTTDATTGRHVDIYIDPTSSGDLFKNDTLITL